MILKACKKLDPLPSLLLGDLRAASKAIYISMDYKMWIMSCSHQVDRCTGSESVCEEQDIEGKCTQYQDAPFTPISFPGVQWEASKTTIIIPVGLLIILSLWIILWEIIAEVQLLLGGADRNNDTRYSRWNLFGPDDSRAVWRLRLRVNYMWWLWPGNGGNSDNIRTLWLTQQRRMV